MEKKKTKAEQYILLIFFLAVIAVPAILVPVNTGRYLPGDNRMAAELPPVINEEGTLAVKEFEAFIDDNIGFRTAAPALDMAFMYGMFGQILDDNQLQGKNGNLFAGDNRRFPSLRAPYAPLTEEELALNGRNIKAASDYFRSEEMDFLFLTIPDKEEVYSNLYPDTFLKRPVTSRLEQQVEWLLSNTDVDAYDMTNDLRKKAEEFDGMLWYETDDSAHWNDMGAWEGYRLIMDRLKLYDPAVRPLAIENFDIDVSKVPYANWDGSVVFDGMENTVYKFNYKPGYTGYYVDMWNDPWMPAEQLETAGFQEGGRFYHYHNDTKEGQLVFFGDSYIYQFLIPYFAESYEDVWLFHMPTDFSVMKPILTMIGADYVVLEMVERTYGTTGLDAIEAQLAAETPVLTRPEDYPIQD